jgi:hypothetical protein
MPAFHYGALDPYIRRPEHSDQAAEPVRAPRTFAQFLRNFAF